MCFLYGTGPLWTPYSWEAAGGRGETETVLCPAAGSWEWNPWLWSQGFSPLWPGWQAASSCSCSSPRRAGSLWRPPGQDGVLICAQPTFGQGEQMGGGSFPVLIVKPFFIPPLLCLPSPPLYCIFRDLLGVFQRWILERWGKPLWRKANSLYLASFFLSCRAQQFMASSTALKKWTRPETMILSVQSWKTLLQLYHP